MFTFHFAFQQPIKPYSHQVEILQFKISSLLLLLFFACSLFYVSLYILLRVVISPGWIARIHRTQLVCIAELTTTSNHMGFHLYYYFFLLLLLSLLQVLGDSFQLNIVYVLLARMCFVILLWWHVIVNQKRRKEKKEDKKNWSKKYVLF